MLTPPPLTRVEHPRLGFALDLPDDWTVAADEPGLPALVARAPRDGDALAPALVVDVRPLPEPLSLEQFEREQQRGLPQQLPGYQCLEISRCTLGGDDGLFRLCDYIVDTISVTGAQWTAFHHGDLVVLSVTTPSELYPELETTLEAIAASFIWEAAR